MLSYLVQIQVKPEFVDAFINATQKNVSASRQEAGITRFDLLQHAEDPAQFYLVEEYKTPEDVTAHKETAHYKEWREAVEKMMAAPRKGNKYKKID
jgi:(4S)-4-hydroxy-5-phosphonooxypentane-2,3-dione isomerase